MRHFQRIISNIAGDITQMHNTFKWDRKATLRYNIIGFCLYPIGLMIYPYIYFRRRRLEREYFVEQL